MIEIQEQVPLDVRNWFKTGGKARYYTRPSSIHEWHEAITFARSRNLPITILGEGANVLVADDGINGLVIHPQEKEIDSYSIASQPDAIWFRASAGTTLETLIAFALDNNAVGIEDLSGIPGSVGGATYMNAHYFEHYFGNVVVEATIIHMHTGEIKEVDHDWFNFGYDFTTLHQEPYAIVDVVVKLKKVTPLEAAYAKGRSFEIVRHRKHRYPYERTCGSFFKNFDQTDKNLIVVNEKPVTAVAYYLDALGLKGTLRVGGASISSKHANMIVTSPGATSADIVALARKMQEAVWKAYGLLPKSECVMLGFGAYPLHESIVTD